MTCGLVKNNGIIDFKFSTGKAISLFVSKEISQREMPQASSIGTCSWETRNRSLVKVEAIRDGWKIKADGGKKYRNWQLKFKPDSIIFPTREGECITNPHKLKNYTTYCLSYPGTASSKCAVITTDKDYGWVVGSRPSLNWAKISLGRLEENFLLQLIQDNNEIYIFPFSRSWKEGLSKYRNLLVTQSRKKLKHKILNQPRFFLQMGVRDFFGDAYIKHYTDLKPLIISYQKTVGKNNFVHLFGTNSHGFDKYFPDFTIDEKLGGVDNLKKLVEEIHQLGLLASHHFNPRIAEFSWLEKNPRFEKAVVANPNGNPWIEFYKNSIYFVMNPGNDQWLKFCLKTIRYLKNLGFDYIELDQVAYQRNLFTDEGGFGQGYQKLINLTQNEGLNFWVEGVSDIYELPADCFFQILPRDRCQLWETNENRRGYAYGTPFTSFYRTLMPQVPVSYQVVTDTLKVNQIPKRLRLAKKFNARIYDLELGFVKKTFKERLGRTLNKVAKFLKNKH
jgi:hypothetical protein